MTEKEKVIYEIQQYLRNISKSRSDEPAIIPDGIFSSETENSVRDFQGLMGLDVTGRVDYLTFDALVRENQRVIEEGKAPVQVMSIENSDLPLYYGKENEFVEKLRIMLDFVADKHSNFKHLERGKVFDRETESEVKRWQRVIAVADNGVVDKFTWNSLAEYYFL